MLDRIDEAGDEIMADLGPERGDGIAVMPECKAPGRVLGLFSGKPGNCDVHAHTPS